MARFVLFLSLAAALTAGPAAAEDSIDATLRLVRPDPSECGWAQIQWHVSPLEARRQALKEGKPVLVATAVQGSVAGCL